MIKQMQGFKQVNSAGVPRKQGLYDFAHEHDNCGTGMIVRLDNEPSHELVRQAIQILVNLEHRGAVGGDKATGDGAGLLLQMPDRFMRREAKTLGFELPERGKYSVGFFFMPVEKDLRERCVKRFEEIAEEYDCPVMGWREVPYDDSELGHIATSSMPGFYQAFLNGERHEPVDFERKLYVIRRKVEHEVMAWERDEDIDTSAFYPCSLSSRTVNYKGLLTGTQLTKFYPDLAEDVFESAFALVHQRYSTNTLPTWKLAQPFRTLCHNGEINTLRGNINQMRAREAGLVSEVFGDDIDNVRPIVDELGSDSACFDNVLEFLELGGRDIPHAMMMMVPEAWGQKFLISEDKRAFYEYHSAKMEPWDGPASMAFTDGDRYIGAVLDRNGLRPSRYTVTKDGLVVMASETGVLEIDAENILQRGRLEPGKMFLVDLYQHRLISDTEIKNKMFRRKPYRHWVHENRIELRGMLAPGEAPHLDAATLLRLQHTYGYTEEELRILVQPMAVNGQEPIGSMGNDAALAVLSNRPQLIYNYFKQLFAQVTNPPIDPLREQLVMSLMSFVGREGNLLDEQPEDVRRLKLHHPILTLDDMERLQSTKVDGLDARPVDMLFPAGGDGEALRTAIEKMFADARRQIEGGATVIVLTDRNMDRDRVPMPALLATAALHHHLIREGLRTHVGLVVESGEPREVMHFALLVGYGANAVCPRGAFASIRQMADENMLGENVTANVGMDNFITAVKKGLLKTFSKMGISTVRSYFGAQIFEAIGLNSEIVDAYFTKTASRIEGIGLEQIAQDCNKRHKKAWPGLGRLDNLLDMGGEYHFRAGGEKHLWTPESIYKMQHAVRMEDYKTFKEYSKLIDEQSEAHATLRSLFKFRAGNSIPIDEVEPVEAITSRFVTAAMSFGSISKEAHESIAIALNRIGGRSNSGEGGEDPERFIPLPNGDSRRSAIKQIASGRFGVTTEYLVNADELQIKMAQGAKPGEGGQLPGHKVNEEIARVRHTTPGVTLISPPPHHDIYSIEDLAQLIFDLKMGNPAANVSVKLVSEVGVGTIASGVAKAKSDLVLISGQDGGTGASPLSSIKHAGLPWELGLAETQQSLIYNHLRDKIRVQVDGQLKTGRDVAIAALLGAEEFGFGTTVLVALGCVMMRKCHLNTCPVGVATQDECLRARFVGKPEHVVNFLQYIAQELREIMAELGFRTLEEMIGRVDMLEFEPALEHYKARGLDLSQILTVPEDDQNIGRTCTKGQEHVIHEQFDQELIKQAAPALNDRKPVEINVPIRNTQRTLCGTLSGELVKRQGAKGLPEDTLKINMTGSAGQSLGAWLAPGITIRVEGDVNDYLGKGMSGGKIIVVPPKNATFIPHENIIAGNVMLYGATGGEIYLKGIVGERFGIRNSGAKAVVEGVGNHGCEYMTGGVVVVLGSTGYNFAAGMSGGMAFVYDETQLFETRCNLDMVDLESVWTDEDETLLRGMIERHYEYTNSERAKMILDNWQTKFPLFVKVMPVEYRRVLERQKEAERNRDAETVSATEEVYNG